jgi:hypothetical protein
MVSFQFETSKVFVKLKLKQQARSLKDFVLMITMDLGSWIHFIFISQ